MKNKNPNCFVRRDKMGEETDEKSPSYSSITDYFEMVLYSILGYVCDSIIKRLKKVECGGVKE